MGADNRAEIVLDGDVSPLRQKLREASADLKKLGAEGSTAIGSMTGPLGALQSKFIAIGALLTGGAVFGKAVSAAKDFHIEVGKLAKVMGVYEGTAVALRYALGDLYVDTDTANMAISKLVQTMNKSPEKFAALGVSIVDANGKTRDMLAIMLDVNARIMQFAEGTDRSRAAAYVYGKQWLEVQKILQLTIEKLEQGAAKARSLGIELKTDDIKAYRAAMNDASDVMDAMQIRIGTALIPSLKALAVYFADVGGPVINAVVWGFKHLVQFLDETVTMIRLVWNDTRYVFDQLTTAAGQMGASLASILKGNIGDAKEIWAEGNRQIEANERKHQEEYERINREHGERIVKLWEGVGAAKAKAQGPTKRFTLADDDADKKNRKDPGELTHMPTYEAVLAERKNLYEQENVLRQFSKEQELAYWRDLQATYQINSKDQLAIAKRTATLELEIRREAAKSERDLRQAGIDHQRAAAVAQVQYEEQRARFARENGGITQRQLIALEEDFARRRFEIEYQAALDRLDLTKNDPAASATALAAQKEQMLEIERNYQLRKGELTQDKKKADGSLGAIFEDVGASFGNAANAIMTRATTLQQQLGGIFQGIFQSFVSNLISKPLGEWIAGLARMLAVKMGFLAAEKAADTASTAATVIAAKVEAAHVIPAEAAIAAGGAAGAVAGIPIVGPAMAAAAYAQTMAMVMSGLGVASAAKGYDIPKGLNPMTQLHEEEMVLPQRYAEVIRGLADGQREGGGGDIHNHNVTIQAMDGADVRRVLSRHYFHVASALRKAARNGVPVGGRSDS